MDAPSTETPRQVAMIGIDVMILNGEHDPDQGWLPFVCAVLSTTIVTTPPMDVPARQFRDEFDRQMVKYLVGCPLIRPSYAEQAMFDVTSLPQHPLPFREFLRIDRAELKQLKAQGWPYFDRREPSGGLIARQVPSTLQLPNDPVLLPWLFKNCRGRFHLSSHSGLVFTRAVDATAFDLWMDEGGQD